MLTYSGKVAVLTGGTGDLGQAILKQLRGAGLQVAFTYHQQSTLAEQLVLTHGAGDTWALPLHTPQLSESQGLAATIRQRWGRVDYLVNNAGAIRDRAFANLSEEEWYEVQNANLNTAFAATRALIFDLLKRPGNALVNISSAAALLGASGQTNYAAAKAGLIGFSRSLAREYGKLGLRVNVVAPGYVVSRMTSQLPERAKAKALKQIPLQRFGEADEVAAAVAFLLSDQAGYIQGQVLSVDGGLAM